MESNKVHDFIDRLAEKTARNEYDWKSLSENPDALNELNNSDIIFKLNMEDSYYIETPKQRIFLLNYFDVTNIYKVIILDLNSKEYYIMDINGSSYFRIESLIRNSHQVRDKMLDDFFSQ